MEAEPYRSIRASDLNKESSSSAAWNRPARYATGNRGERQGQPPIPCKPSVGSRPHSRQLDDDEVVRVLQVPYPTQAYVDHGYERLSKEESGAIRSQRSLFQAPRSTSAVKTSAPRPGDRRVDRVSIMKKAPEQRSERIILPPETNIKII